MVKVAFRYNPELVQWIKDSGSGSVWNREEKVWEIPEEILEDLKEKARELGVELKTQPVPVVQKGAQQPETSPRQQEGRGAYIEYDPLEASKTATPPRDAPAIGLKGGGPKEGEIRLRRSRDGRFVLISINLIAFSSDVEDLLKGTKSSVRFRVLPPPTFRQPESE
ncbi:MAG: hypothetical protein QFX35_01690 [Candidatus Verstraetearchaeota archaeon]|nr:hypothetical protein [Candidatus Verstraetearchaeota archaeon]